MRYHDDGVAVFLVYRLDQLQDFLGGLIIQCSCRLIAEKNVRILYNGTADSSPLLLTAGKLVWKLSLVLIDSQRMEQFIYIQRLITEIGSHLYILPHCKIWDQIIHLKNISQMLTSVQRQFLLRHICQTFPVYDQISLIRTVNPTDNIQKRGLTGTGRSQKHTKLPSLNVKIQPLQHIHPAVPCTKRLLNTLYLQKHFFIPPSYPLSVEQISFI